MGAIHVAASYAVRIVSFSQVLLYLPLALDIAGKECMLALSLGLACYWTFLATLQLATRRTRFAAVGTFFSFLQHLVVPAFLLLALNLFSSSDRRASAGSAAWQWGRWAVGAWEWVLRSSSPIFTLLEGLATLLTIQAMSRFSTTAINRSTNPDVLQLVLLILSSIIYVFSSYFIYASYSFPSLTIGTATLIGISITSVLFLSAISFALRKGNVLETSLILAYATFQIYGICNRPFEGGKLQEGLLSGWRLQGKNGNPPLPELVIQSFDAISAMITTTFGTLIDFVAAASSALPFAVLLGLFYRVTVLYAASRIILALKRESLGYSGGETPRLREEEWAARVMTVGIAFSRLILTAVYTHLLLLSKEGTKDFWQWINVFLTLGLWGIELSIGQSDDNHWKDD